MKDTILRYHVLNGNKVHYIPGWDCHGLPIELKAISNSDGMNPIEVRSKGKKYQLQYLNEGIYFLARDFATKTVEEQKAVFKSWGVIGDWKNAYMTFNTDYVKIQFRLFYKLYKKNLIYRDIKPIYWSPSTKYKQFLICNFFKEINFVFYFRTALAEAELEYNESHKSPSAYVRFEIKDIPKLKILKDKR